MRDLDADLYLKLLDKAFPTGVPDVGDRLLAEAVLVGLERVIDRHQFSFFDRQEFFEGIHHAMIYLREHGKPVWRN